MQHLLQRYNQIENKHINRPENVEIFASKVRWNLREIFEENQKEGNDTYLFSLGSRKLASHGFFGVYKVLKVYRCACVDGKEVEIEPFNQTVWEERMKLQWRVKVKCVKVCTPNSLGDETVRRLKSCVGMCKISAEEANEIYDALEAGGHFRRFKRRIVILDN